MREKRLMSLIHNGVHVPKYDYLGLCIKYKDRTIWLDPEQELMVIAIVKKFNTVHIKNPVFIKNFLSDFCNRLGLDEANLSDFDFSEAVHHLENEKRRRSEMSKEEKRRQREERKKRREAVKGKYGYALVDGKRVAIKNWSVEPPGIYMSKGKHPLRGHWKRLVREKNITLNLSPDAPIPEGEWKVEWNPNALYVARYRSPLTGRWKYAWLSDTSPLRAEREREKFDKALELEKNINRVMSGVRRELFSRNLKTRRIATAVYLINTFGLRVGDERNKEESGTVGCLTLSRENFNFSGNKLTLDFVGKNYIHWTKIKKAHPKVVENIKEFLGSRKDGPFRGLDSSDVSKFLDKYVPGCSAKTFRTMIAGKIFEKAIRMRVEKLSDPDCPLNLKKYVFKIANLRVAKELNHKRKLPKRYGEMVEKRKNHIAKINKKIRKTKGRLKKCSGKKGTKRLKERLRKQREKKLNYILDYKIYRSVSEWNLSTSLNSYIDPRRVAKFCLNYNYPIEKAYNKSLREKFGWAFPENCSSNLF